MKKFFLTCLCVLFLWNAYVNANIAEYYEYADIKNTDTINFNWEINNKTYQVYIDDSKLFQIDWKSWKKHYCYKIIWTWYTYKLWEVYFQYKGKWSYACEDNKLRWVFKIWAGWRGSMEDLNWSDWSVSVNWSSHNWSFHHDWKSRIAWVWFASWPNVTNKKTQEIFSEIN